jgi:late competence protein required for DNA uptake (superfamily II DNA/RNA helicase)
MMGIRPPHKEETIDLTAEEEMLYETTHAATVCMASVKCSVCQEETMKDPATIPCYHVFCHACLLQALESSGKCPMCRKKTYSRQIRRLYFS